MKVKKRNGQSEDVNFQKILVRISRETYGLDMNYVEPVNISRTVIDGLYDGVTTYELDKLAMETAASMTAKHPDYALLAGRLAVSALHKETPEKFSRCVNILYKYINPETGEPAPLVSKEFYDTVKRNSNEFDKMIKIERDFTFDYFGFKTLEKSYLLKVHRKPIERPQYLYMRVAIGLWGDNMEMVQKTYDLLSTHKLSHATPTMFNSGTPRPQNSSCFLLKVEDSIENIMDNMKEMAMISKNAGGIGLAVSDIRAKGSYIRGTNGISNGLVPYLRTLNNLSVYVDQGGQKRKGSFAIYIEPWHSDFLDFIELKKTHGQEDMRARDLFYAIMMPDLFMKRVEANENWSFFCPNEAKGLTSSYGDEFEKLFTKYEEAGIARRTIPARKVFEEIIKTQIETGTPYIVFKDAANLKSNQKNIGPIYSSNLCSEILIATGFVPKKRNGIIEKDARGNDVTEFHTGVCNLLSIPLPKLVLPDKTFDFDELGSITRQSVRNLNKVIDVNYYPTDNGEVANKTARPIGIGVQGWHDVLFKMGIDFDSEQAKQLNKDIWETMYYNGVLESSEIAKEEGSYEWFDGSPMSQGIFQFDMWGVTPSDRFDWEDLRARMMAGMRNSLLFAQMPTASTASILGNTESIEAITSNFYTRRVLSGEYIIVNKYLINDLVELGLWTDEIRMKIIQGQGSVQNIEEIPAFLRKRYRTAWEISQRVIIEQSADRGAYICQTQSLNLFLPKPNIAQVSSMIIFGWKQKLKTGIYYLRQQGSAQAINFAAGKTVTKTDEPKSEEATMASITASTITYTETVTKKYTAEEEISCSIESGEDCEACGA